MNFQLSTLSQSDSAAYSLFRAGLQQQGIYDPTKDAKALESLLNDCDNFHADNKAWKMTAGDQIVGHIVVNRNVEKYGSTLPFTEITHIDVIEPYRRKGVGARLYNRVFLWSIEQSLDYVDICLNKDDLVKIAFLKKMGFTRAVSLFNKKVVFVHSTIQNKSGR